MHLLQRLPNNPLDIVGDIHGELAAMLALLDRLGYDHKGRHPYGRKLVFVGDLCDRGPDSQGVIQHVQLLFEEGNAFAILGNHEINLLTRDIKDGSGWFFDERHDRDLKYYAPFRRTPAEERAALASFLARLPIALYRDDIRIVHAAWTPSAIEAIRSIPAGGIVEHFQAWNREAQSLAVARGLYDRYLDEKTRWAQELEDEQASLPFLHAIAEYEATQQMVNPLKVLTSGVEQKASLAFFSGNRWRFSDRTTWWNDYQDEVPVVVGHYWRLFDVPADMVIPRYSELFQGVPSTAWHGARRNVFCVDFSVGARWRDRRAGRPISESRYRLAALQWPENRLVFDSGEIIPTFRG